MKPNTIFLATMLFTSFYQLACLLDLLLTQHLEKKQNWYPMIEFTCFCGHYIDHHSTYLIPTRTYNFYRMRKHTRGCLLWILNADFNGLTPYWAHSYAKDLKEISEGRGFASLGVDYFLKAAKERSARVRAGKSPWDDSSETI